MTLILNVIWLVCAGLWLALGYMAAGIVAFITIILAPFGVASFRMAFFALWPFGKTVIEKPNAGAGAAILNVLWFVLAGLWLAIGHLISAFLLAITILGIPLALGSIKMIPVTCFPFGKRIVDSRTPPPAHGRVLYRS